MTALTLNTNHELPHGPLADQDLLSMGFSRQEYWSELPIPTQRYLPDSRIESESLTSPALAGRFYTTEPPGKPVSCM